MNSSKFLGSKRQYGNSSIPKLESIEFECQIYQVSFEEIFVFQIRLKKIAHVLFTLRKAKAVNTSEKMLQNFLYFKIILHSADTFASVY